MSKPIEYEHKDIQQVEFSWKKPEKGFIFDDQAKPVPMFTPQVQGPFVIETPGAKDWVRFDALLQQETMMFMEFAETVPDQDGILDFANRWGMLTQGETRVTTPKHPAGSKPVSQRHAVVVEDGGKKHPAVPSLPAESLSFWTREIIDMGQLFKVWEWWKSKDYASLRRILTWDDDRAAVRYSLPIWQAEAGSYDFPGPESMHPNSLLASKNPDYNLEDFKRFRPGRYFLPAQFLLKDRVNAKLKVLEDKGIASIRPRLLMNIENKTIPYLTPSNLLAALWLQFYQAIYGERSYKRCGVCGYWEDPSTLCDREGKPLQRPSRWTGHTHCLNAKYQREWRERQKAKSKGRD
jgi:hypothetical protein